MSSNIKVFVTLSKVHRTECTDRYLTIRVNDTTSRLPPSPTDRIIMEKEILNNIKDELDSRLIFKFYHVEIDGVNVLRFRLKNNSLHGKKGLIPTVNQVLDELRSLYSSVIFCEKEFFRFKEEKRYYDWSDEEEPDSLLQKYMKYKRESKIEVPYPINENFLDSLL